PHVVLDEQRMIEGAGAKALPPRDMGQEAPQRSFQHRGLRAGEPRRDGIRQIAALDVWNADQRMTVGRELRLQPPEALRLLIEVDGEDDIVWRSARRLPSRGEARHDRTAGAGAIDDGLEAGQLGITADDWLQPGGRGVEFLLFEIDLGSGALDA